MPKERLFRGGYFTKQSKKIRERKSLKLCSTSPVGSIPVILNTYELLTGGCRLGMQGGAHSQHGDMKVRHVGLTGALSAPEETTKQG